MNANRKQLFVAAAVVGLLAMSVVVGLAGLWREGIFRSLAGRSRMGPGPPDPTSLSTHRRDSMDDGVPAIRLGRHLNTTAQAQYVGSDACRDCHPSQFESYQQTHHSQAMDQIALDKEPPDGRFYHAPSRREYVSRREGDRLVHAEILRDANGELLVEDVHQVTMAIGSGHHSRSYLIERDGYYYESPLTWYAAKQGWWISPGYDRPIHDSFERPVDIGCVHCHAGNVETVDGNRYRIRIIEKSIGCESCHGPGSVHVGERLKSDPGEEEDPTIVNPARLERMVSEHICARCHLRGAASVMVRGRRLEQYRPGLFLTDFRVNYIAEGQRQMTVVGHVEQMRQSACWQKSQTLTCITCHDPHLPVPQDQRDAHYRAMCLKCHQAEQCKVAEPRRRERTQHDSCVVCHMPQSPTDIPHFAFTHHRIGIHSSDKPGSNLGGASPSSIRLVPLDDISHLPDLERRRCLGLAYAEFADKVTSAELQTACQQQAMELLEGVIAAGLDDADVWAAVARIAWQLADTDRAMDAALRASKTDTPSGARLNSLIVIADVLVSHNHFAEAEIVARQITGLRNFSADYVLLATCQAQAGKTNEAIASLEKAVSLNPFRALSRDVLVRLLQQSGRDAEAATHKRILENLP